MTRQLQSQRTVEQDQSVDQMQNVLIKWTLKGLLACVVQDIMGMVCSVILPEKLLFQTQKKSIWILMMKTEITTIHPMFHQASKQLQKAPDLGIPHNPGYNHSFQHKFRILMMKMLLCVFLGFAHVQMI